MSTDQKQLTEQEIRTNYITPALHDAEWKGPTRLREEYYTAGKFLIQKRGKAERDQPQFADYLLSYKEIPPTKRGE